MQAKYAKLVAWWGPLLGDSVTIEPCLCMVRPPAIVLQQNVQNTAIEGRLAQVSPKLFTDSLKQTCPLSPNLQALRRFQGSPCSSRQTAKHWC